MPWPPTFPAGPAPGTPGAGKPGELGTPVDMRQPMPAAQGLVASTTQTAPADLNAAVYDPMGNLAVPPTVGTGVPALPAITINRGTPPQPPPVTTSTPTFQPMPQPLAPPPGPFMPRPDAPTALRSTTLPGPFQPRPDVPRPAPALDPTRNPALDRAPGNTALPPPWPFPRPPGFDAGLDSLVHKQGARGGGYVAQPIPDPGAGGSPPIGARPPWGGQPAPQPPARQPSQLLPPAQAAPPVGGIVGPPQAPGLMQLLGKIFAPNPAY
jgi:hypothetical protein